LPKIRSTASRKKSKRYPIKTAGVLTLDRPGSMTEVGRIEIARWLRSQAKLLLKYGKDYTTTRFTSRYLYTSQKRASA